MFHLFKKKSLPTELAPAKIPGHVAFICDGNRRWAKERGLPPLEGHRAGISNFEKMTDWFVGRGVSTISFFIFSTENWDRGKEEVRFLMSLFYAELKKNLKHAIEKNLRYKVAGSRDKLPPKLAKLCDDLEEKSAGGTNGTVCFCLNYGGRDEIVSAVNAVVADGAEVDAEAFESYLNTGDLPPIDFMIRTSSEQRISNFLLWKLAYAELFFPPYHWPEFVKSPARWQEILDEYGRRDRRFGGGIEKNYKGGKK